MSEGNSTRSPEWRRAFEPSDRDALLARLNFDRWVIAAGGNVAREFSRDRSECRIVAVRATSGFEGVIDAEKESARRGRYSLEWKVYSHDGLVGLEDALVAAGFEPEPEEAVLVFPFHAEGSAEGRSPLQQAGAVIERIHDERGLRLMADISTEIVRRGVEGETARLAAVLKETPEEMSIHVLSVDGEPVSCGRTHFAQGSSLAELAGGRTKTLHRGKGYFRALVEHRLREARSRGCIAALVDALPTSEPILTRLGFVPLTRTRPFTFVPHEEA